MHEVKLLYEEETGKFYMDFYGTPYEIKGMKLKDLEDLEKEIEIRAKQNERQRIVEELEGMKVNLPDNIDGSISKKNFELLKKKGWNECVSEAIKIIKNNE